MFTLTSIRVFAQLSFQRTLKTFKSADKATTWNFIVGRASRWVGFPKKLVLSIGRPFKKMTGRTTLSVDGLQSILIEISAIANARAATYVYSDSDYEAITYPLSRSDHMYGQRITTEHNNFHLRKMSTSHSLTTLNVRMLKKECIVLINQTTVNIVLNYLV